MSKQATQSDSELHEQPEVIKSLPSVWLGGFTPISIKNYDDSNSAMRACATFSDKIFAGLYKRGDKVTVKACQEAVSNWDELTEQERDWMTVQWQGQVTGMITEDPEANSRPSESPSAPPKDNQIDEILARFESETISDARDAMNGRPGARTFGVDDSPKAKCLTALATAIREATPGQLTEFHGQGTMQLEATVHQAAIDQFLANLKNSGLEV